jgi:hypothetical protein
MEGQWVQYDPQSPAEVAAMARLRELEGEFAALSEADLIHFEDKLYVWAAVKGWTGDWHQAPATAVLAAYERMVRERDGATGE